MDKEPALTQAPEPSCKSCGMELLWVGENIGLARYKCPGCGVESLERYRPLIPRDDESVILSILWITRKPTLEEIRGLQQIWGEFQESSPEVLLKQWANTEEVAFAQMPWSEARPIVQRGWDGGISLSYALAEC